jgi:hypothetical protein
MLKRKRKRKLGTCHLLRWSLPFYGGHGGRLPSSHHRVEVFLINYFNG